MPTRRQFLSGALAGAAAVALGGCSGSGAEQRTTAGIQPIKYGEARSQIAELLLPNDFGPFPVVVIIHGGWWREGWDRTTTRDIARDLVKRGVATWNLEYRLVGEEGGGWPGTFEDVAAGIDALADAAPDYNLDLDRVVLLGHSAGGQLAQWASVRADFIGDVEGARPRVVPIAAIAQAPVADLVAASEAGLGSGAVDALLGGTPNQVPLNYFATSPKELVPFTTPQFVYHPVDDQIVPIELSRSFAEAAAAQNSPVELVELEGVGHFDILDVDSQAWEVIRDQIPEIMEGTRGSVQSS